MRRVSWTLLLAVLLGLLFFSYLFGRPGGVRLGSEASYLMAAESLAFDGDLIFTRADFDRHLLTWLGEPPALTLRSASGGHRITYGVSPAYSLWLAPFVRQWPRQGFAMANCLLLLLVGVGVAVLWQRRRGSTAPALLALCLFLSLLFSSPFVADGGLFLALAALLAFTLLASPGDGRRVDAAALAAGALLALPCVHLFSYGLLVPAAVWMVGGRRRWSLLLAFSAMTVLLVAIPWLASGGLASNGLGDLRQGAQVATFTPATGFPLVDFGADEWRLRLHALAERQTAREVSPVATGGAVYGYAMVDRWLGRHLGILPWFPLVVPLWVAACWLPRRRPLALATLAWSVLLVWQNPFDLELGGPLWAAGRFLPLYAALVASLAYTPAVDSELRGGRWRRSRGDWRAWALRVVWGLAVGVGLWTLPAVWSSPWRAPMALTGTSEASLGALDQGFELPWRRHLPQETTQRRLMHGGTTFGGLVWWSLDGHGWAERQSRRLVIPSDGPSLWLVGSPEPLPEIDAESLLTASGLGVLPTDGASMQLVLQPISGPAGARRHAVGWTHGPSWLYRLQATVSVQVEGSRPPPGHLILHPLIPHP